MQDLDDEFDDDLKPLTPVDVIVGGAILVAVTPIALAALAADRVIARLSKLVALLALLIITGCSELTVEDVVEACVVQCVERGGGDACHGPECRVWAELYSDCVPEAYALADCMPGECSAVAAELYACACVNDHRSDCGG